MYICHTVNGIEYNRSDESTYVWERNKESMKIRGYFRLYSKMWRSVSNHTEYIKVSSTQVIEKIHK